MPRDLGLAGRGRRRELRNLFDLSAWFPRPSGPDPEGKEMNTGAVWCQEMAAHSLLSEDCYELILQGELNGKSCLDQLFALKGQLSLSPPHSAVIPS